jgi:hypothetical protein
VTGEARDRLVDGLGSGSGLEHAPAAVQTATGSAFVDALGTGLTISAGAAFLAAVVAWKLIDARPPAHPEAVPALEGEATPVPG